MSSSHFCCFLLFCPLQFTPISFVCVLSSLSCSLPPFSVLSSGLLHPSAFVLLSWTLLSCCVMSCQISFLSSSVLSSPVLFCPLLSSPALFSYNLLSPPLLFYCPFISCPFPVLSHPWLFSPFIFSSSPLLFCPLLPSFLPLTPFLFSLYSVHHLVTDLLNCNHFVLNQANLFIFQRFNLKCDARWYCG